jgi:hypothetical protein
MRMIPHHANILLIYKIVSASWVRILDGVTPNFYKIRPGDLLIIVS